MTPEVRAAADRFMMDCANLRYLIAGGSRRMRWNVK